MRWGHFHLHSAVHLISRLAATASPHRGSLGVRRSKASPSRGGGSAERRDGEVVPERDNLSVCFADSSPERGAFSLRRANPSGPSGQLPLTRGALVPRKKVTRIKISTAPSIDGSRSTATSYKSDTPVSGGAYQTIREVTTEWNDN